MYSVLPGISLPEDRVFLWKYMSLEKFVSLLGTKSLFFTRADKFDDPFEGFTPPSVKSFYHDTVADINTLEKFQENWPKYILCSCWHHAEEESMAMWEKYHMHNSGIAVKTTFGDFKDCLSEGYEVFLGKIEYINHYEYPVPQILSEMSMLYTWYFRKRKTFEYEREFRAIIANPQTFFMKYIDKDGNFISSETIPEIILNKEFRDTCKTGMSFNVDVNTLIGEVITSPYSDDWVTETVRSVVKQYGFDFEVNASTLLDEPIETV